MGLVRASLGEGNVPRTLDYWRWKHEDNPFGRSPVLLAEVDGALVGLRAFMQWEWETGGRMVGAVRAVDTATHPEYRGQGIFKRLTVRLRDEMEAEGVAFVYNTPNDQSRPGYLKMGWASVGKPTLWVRPTRPFRLAKALRSGGTDGAEKTPPIVQAPLAAEGFRDATLRSIVEAATNRTGAYHTAKPLPILKWRYAHIPGFDYHTVWSGEGEQGAVAVFRTRQRGALRELRICDLLVGPAPEARTHARRVLAEAVGSADVDAAIALPPAIRGGARLLASAGFLPVPRSGPILTVYSLNITEGRPDPSLLSSWCPSIGDLELF